MKGKVICIAVSLCAILGCEHSRRLSDDFSWMNNTYNPHSGVSNTAGHGRTGWFTRNGNTDVLVEGSIETFSNDGCMMTIKNEPNLSALSSREIHGESVHKFNLRDIDPGSVRLKLYSHYGGFDCSKYSTSERNLMLGGCDHAEVVASTHNEAPLVDEYGHTVYEKLSGKDHDAYGKAKETGIFFEFDDTEYANKFAKVFQEVVSLCGGTRGPGN